MGPKELEREYLRWGASRKRAGDSIGRYGQGGKAAIGHLGARFEILASRAGDAGAHGFADDEYRDRTHLRTYELHGTPQARGGRARLCADRGRGRGSQGGRRAACERGWRRRTGRCLSAASVVLRLDRAGCHGAGVDAGRAPRDLRAGRRPGDPRLVGLAARSLAPLAARGGRSVVPPGPPRRIAGVVRASGTGAAPRTEPARGRDRAAARPGDDEQGGRGPRVRGMDGRRGAAPPAAGSGCPAPDTGRGGRAERDRPQDRRPGAADPGQGAAAPGIRQAVRERAGGRGEGAGRAADAAIRRFDPRGRSRRRPCQTASITTR